MTEIRAYADACNIKPATVLQRAAGYGGKAWEKWEAGGQCTLATAETIRKHMAENPPTNASLQKAS